MFNEIILPLIARAQRNDVMLAYIRHSSLEKPIFITPQKARSFEPKSFLDAIYRVSQSNRTFLLDGELALEVSVTKPLENMGVNPMTTLEELEKRKKMLFVL
jgi:hypothetical protein